MIEVLVLRVKFRREPILRTARIIYLLTKGKQMTTREIAGMTGLTENGAWRMMVIIASSHYVPVTFADGKWQIAVTAREAG